MTLDAIAPSKLYTISPAGVAELSPHPGQAATWESDARIVAMIAGSQGGKTSFGPWWLWREIDTRGGGDYLVGATDNDLAKLKLLPELQTVFIDVLGMARYHPGLRTLELRDPVTGRFWAKRSTDLMWGRIILRSAADPAGFESTTAKAAWLDEFGMDAWTLEILNSVYARLALAKGRLLLTTSIYNAGLLKSAIVDRWKAGDPDVDVVQFESTINPSFPKDEYNRLKAIMDETDFAMRYEAKFAKPRGLIYHAFDEGRMLVDVPANIIKKETPRKIGIDFGGANMASLYLYEDTSVKPSRFIAYDEYIEGGESTNEHVRRMDERLAGASDVVVAGGQPAETQQRRDWAAAGRPVYGPGIKEVELGIAAVIELLKSDRVRVSRKLLRLRHEFSTYRRRMLPDGSISEVIDDKSTFHLLDALRAIAVYIKYRNDPSRHVDSV